MTTRCARSCFLSRPMRRALFKSFRCVKTARRPAAYRRGVPLDRSGWSPDGQQIAFTSNRDYFDADTMRRRKDEYRWNRITKTGSVGSLSWHPKDRRIIFATNKELVIYTFQTDNVLKFSIELENIRPIRWLEMADFYFFLKQNILKMSFICWIPGRILLDSSHLYQGKLWEPTGLYQRIIKNFKKRSKTVINKDSDK